MLTPASTGASTLRPHTPRSMVSEMDHAHPDFSPERKKGFGRLSKTFKSSSQILLSPLAGIIEKHFPVRMGRLEVREMNSASDVVRHFIQHLLITFQITLQLPC